VSIIKLQVTKTCFSIHTHIRSVKSLSRLAQ